MTECKNGIKKIDEEKESKTKILNEWKNVKEIEWEKEGIRERQYERKKE